MRAGPPIYSTMPNNPLDLATPGLSATPGLHQQMQPKTKETGKIMTKSLDPNILSQFTGSEHWYRHGLVRHIIFTDGAKYVADAAGAYWLLGPK